MLIHLCSIWEDSLILPPIFAAVSLLVITVHYISTRKFAKKAWARLTKNPIQEEPSETNTVTTPSGFFAELRHHANSLGGPNVFIYRVLRLLSVFALVSLNAATFILDDSDEAPSANATRKGKHWGKKHKHHRGGNTLTYWEWLDLSVSVAHVSYQYTLIPSAPAKFHRSTSLFSQLLQYLPGRGPLTLPTPILSGFSLAFGLSLHTGTCIPWQPSPFRPSILKRDGSYGPKSASSHLSPPSYQL